MPKKSVALVAQLTNSTMKLNRVSRPFQSLKLEEPDKRKFVLHSTEAILITSFCSTFISNNYYNT